MSGTTFFISLLLRGVKWFFPHISLPPRLTAPVDSDVYIKKMREQVLRRVIIRTSLRSEKEGKISIFIEKLSFFGTVGKFSLSNQSEALHIHT